MMVIKGSAIRGVLIVTFSCVVATTYCETLHSPNSGSAKDGVPESCNVLMSPGAHTPEAGDCKERAVAYVDYLERESSIFKQPDSSLRLGRTTDSPPITDPGASPEGVLTPRQLLLILDHRLHFAGKTKWEQPIDDEVRAVMAAGGSCPYDIYNLVWDASQERSISPATVAALIDVESSCRASVTSSQGAQGLMQLMPNFGAREGYRLVHGVDRRPSSVELRNPETNLKLGLAYLESISAHYSNVHSEQSRLLLTVAAYNWGQNGLDQALPVGAAQWEPRETMAWLKTHAPEETCSYVVDIVNRIALYDKAIMLSKLKGISMLAVAR